MWCTRGGLLTSQAKKILSSPMSTLSNPFSMKSMELRPGVSENRESSGMQRSVVGMQADAAGAAQLTSTFKIITCISLLLVKVSWRMMLQRS